MQVEKTVVEGVCRITLNRPSHHNTLTVEMLEEFSKHLVKLEKEARVLVIEGSGKSFCAGADMHEIFDMHNRDLKRFSVLGKKLCAQIESLNIPTIAVLHGHTLGEGIELALCCDIRVCSDKTTFEFPQMRLGYTPGFGATHKLPALIGESRAFELLLTGIAFDAKTAGGLGLVTQVVPDKSLKKKVDGLLDLILQRNPLAVSSLITLLRSPDPIKETAHFSEHASHPDTKLHIKEIIGEK